MKYHNKHINYPYTYKTLSDLLKLRYVNNGQSISHFCFLECNFASGNQNHKRAFTMTLHFPFQQLILQMALCTPHRGFLGKSSKHYTYNSKRPKRT